MIMPICSSEDPQPPSRFFNPQQIRVRFISFIVSLENLTQSNIQKRLKSKLMYGFSVLIFHNKGCVVGFPFLQISYTLKRVHVRSM